MDIVIYTSPATLTHKKGIRDWSLEGFYWKFKNFPKDLKTGDRLFIAVQGYVRGSFELDYVSRRWNKIQWYTSSWRSLKRKIPCKPCQGFRYRWW